MNQPDAALVDFQNAAKLDRTNIDALLGLGKSLVSLGRADEAVLPLTRVITADPNIGEAYRHRGAGHAGTFKTKQAIEDLEKAISLDPNDHEAYLTLGMVELRDENFPKAVEALEKSIETYKPKVGEEEVPFVQGYLTLSSAYIELGKKEQDEAARKAAYKNATDTCEKLISQLSIKNPLHAQAIAAALYSRGVAERMEGEYVRAIKSLTQAIQYNPTLGDAYFRRGICFHKLGEEHMAISDFEQAAHLAYDDPRSNLWAGLTWAKLGDHHKALRSYGDAIASSDRYTPAYYNRGLTYMALGDYEKAIADFNEAIRLEPNKANSYYMRGLAYERARDNTKAAESFATALEFDNKHVDSYRHMATVMQALGRTELAAEYRNKANELAPPKAKK